MRKSLLLSVAALFLASQASAGPMPFSGTLTLTIGTLPPIVVTGTGTGSSAGAGGAATIPAGVFSLFTSTVISPALLGLIDGIGIAGQPFPGGFSTFGTNAALNFNGATGTMGLNASVYLLMGGFPVAGIPLNVVGVGGTQMFSVFGGLIAGTVTAAPYQLGTITQTGIFNGEPQSAMNTGFDARTPGGAGVLQLVSPGFSSLGPVGRLVAPAVLTLEFVPEPGTLMLLGAGVLGLAALGRRTRKH